MKNLLVILSFATLLVAILVPNMAIAASSSANIISVEEGVVPAKGKSKKELKKQLRSAAKKYRAETKDMTKAEKEAYLLDRIEQQDALPRMQLFIVGLILLLVGILLAGIFWSVIGWLGSVIATIGAIILIIWLILFLLDMA